MATKKPEAPKNEVQKNGNGGGLAIATDQPEWLQKGNRGSENVETRDLILPRLGQIQALSPQIKKSDPTYIEKAEQGQLFNPLTSEIYGESITFVPIIFRKVWVIFKDRKKGGGFFGAYASDKEALDFIRKAENNDGMESIESHEHIGMLVAPSGEMTQMVVTCTRSKIKASRKLNSLVSLAGVDRFAKAYEIRSVEDQNRTGDSYWNLDIRSLGFVPKDTYTAMAEQYEVLKNMTITTNYNDGNSDASAADEKEF